MKSRIVTLAIFLLLVSPYVGASSPPTSSEPERPDLLLADLSLGVIAVAYERVIADFASLSVSGQYYRPWYVSDHVFGFGGELRAFFFMTHDAPEGLYLSPGVRGAYVRAEPESGPTEEGFAWSTRLSLGWSFTFGPHFVLRLGAGVQYHEASLVEADGAVPPNFSGVYPVADIYVGARF